MISCGSHMKWRFWTLTTLKLWHALWQKIHWWVPLLSILCLSWPMTHGSCLHHSMDSTYNVCKLPFLCRHLPLCPWCIPFFVMTCQPFLFVNWSNFHPSMWCGQSDVDGVVWMESFGQSDDVMDRVMWMRWSGWCGFIVWWKITVLSMFF